MDGKANSKAESESATVTRSGRVVRKSDRAKQAEATEAAFAKFRRGLRLDAVSTASKAPKAGKGATGHSSEVGPRKSQRPASELGRKATSVVDNRSTTSQKIKKNTDVPNSQNSVSSDKNEAVMEARRARLKLEQEQRRKEEELGQVWYEFLQKEQKGRIDLLPLVEEAETKELEAGMLDQESVTSEEAEDDEQDASQKTADWVHRHYHDQGSYVPNRNRQNSVKQTVNRDLNRRQLFDDRNSDMNPREPTPHKPYAKQQSDFDIEQEKCDRQRRNRLLEQRLYERLNNEYRDTNFENRNLNGENCNENQFTA